MSGIVIHKPTLDQVSGSWIGQVDFRVHGYPVSLSVAVDQRAIRALQAKAGRLLESHGVTFGGSCCKSCAQKTVFGGRLFSDGLEPDVEESKYLLEKDSELEDAIASRLESLPPEVALYEEVLLASNDPYAQSELQQVLYQLHLDASRGDPESVETYSSLMELAQLDTLRKKWLVENDLLAKWKVEWLESESAYDPEAARLFSLFGSLGAVSEFPLQATYNIGDLLTIPRATEVFGARLKKAARERGVKDTFSALLRKTKRAIFGGFTIRNQCWTSPGESG